MLLDDNIITFHTFVPPFQGIGLYFWFYAELFFMEKTGVTVDEDWISVKVTYPVNGKKKGHTL